MFSIHFLYLSKHTQMYKNNICHYIFFCIVIILTPYLLQAQLSVTSNNSAQQLSQIIVGQGVTVSNAVLNCGQNGSGVFNGSSSNIGLNSGIILTSGSIFNAVGPNIASDISYPDPFSCSGGNAQLDAIVAPQTTFDACVLEFDVVPLGNILSFRYVFGSDEYPEYVCSDYNDVFAFFISGPGIPGSQNIALIPGTSIPVAINSVNPGTPGSNCGIIPFFCPCTSLSYASYYVDNIGGTTVEYDGFTTVLTAKTNVIPCETYRLKLAIADAGDCVYDSGVFIEEGSLNSNIPVVSQATGDILEGCANGFVEFSLASPQATNTTINYLIGGSAINGVDYQTIPNNITIPAGQTSARLDLIAIADTINDPIETIELYIYTLLCDTLFYDTVVVTIREETPVVQTYDTTICRGEQPRLQVSGATTYQWFPTTGLSNPNIADPVFTGDTTTHYTIITYDSNNCRGRALFTVNVLDPPVPVFNPTYNICSGDTISLTVTGGVNYNWSPSAGLSNTNTGSPLAFPTVTTIYNVTVAVGNCVENIQITVNVSNTPNVSAGNDTTVCRGATINLNATGGATYSWSPASGLSNPNIANPAVTISQTTTYTVVADNGSGCTATASVTITAIDALPVFAGQDILKCAEDTVTLNATGAQNFSWLPNSNIINPNTASPQVFPITTTTYIVTATDTNGCITSDSVLVSVIPVVPPDAGTDKSICLGDTVVIGGNPTAQNGYDIVWISLDGNINALNDVTIARPVFNSAHTGSGNFIYLVAATFQGCNAGTDSVTITVHAPSVADFSGLDSIYCLEDAGAALTGIPAGGLFSGPGISGNYFYPSIAGVGNNFVITYSVTDANGCFDDTIKTTSVVGFSIDAGADQTIAIYDSVRLNPSPDALVYQWSPSESLSCADCRNPYASPTVTTTYTLIATDQNGCVAQDNVTVEVFVDTLLWVPNAFTPDGNSVNDVFKVYGKNIKTIDFKIFNRWGELMFVTDNPAEGWDGTYKGKPMPPGVYVFVIKATYVNEFQSKLHKGSFLLLR
jgi:gliding motility-associated-like protein